MKTVFIYSISTIEDPDNVRYIGKSNNLNDRLNRHLQPYYLKEDTYKTRWLKKEIINGNTPIISIVDVVPESEWSFWETYWIAQFKVWGFKLTNTTIGGDGIKLTKEIVLKRNKTKFDKNTIKLSSDLIKFNIHKEKDTWVAERQCSKCKSLIYYKRKTRREVFSEIRRGEKENRTCVTCDLSNRSGHNNSFFGKTHKPELQKILRDIAPKKKVLMLSLKGDILKEFESIREAERSTGVHRKHISSCCSGKPHYLTAGGFKWKYA